jgi:hypothetical protein
LVGLFNKKKIKMSWQIPTQIEQDIIAGKATYRTFQTGNGGQSILTVPPNSYAVIFGYDFSPAGGGIESIGNVLANDGGVASLSPVALRWFETQQISFYTGTDFYPFIHHIDKTASGVITDPGVASYRSMLSIDTTPIARQVYITSSNDVTITHGLILNSNAITSNLIPVTSRTPGGLTYGGSGINNTTQTNYGPGAAPLQFMQPSPKDYQDFAFGLLPNNADGQSFATPDAINGLNSAFNILVSLGISAPDAAASNYYLCLHYALYSTQIPNTQG